MRLLLDKGWMRLFRNSGSFAIHCRNIARFYLRWIGFCRFELFFSFFFGICFWYCWEVCEGYLDVFLIVFRSKTNRIYLACCFALHLGRLIVYSATCLGNVGGVFLGVFGTI